MRLGLSIGTALLAAAMMTPAGVAQTRRVQVITAPSAPYLGIGVKDIDADAAKKFNLKEVRGVEITQIENGSPADKAGLKEGDVVLEYNGERVEGGAQLARMVRETPAGRQVKIGVWRNGSMQTVTATVEEKKPMPALPGGGRMFTMPDMRGLEELRNFKMPDFDMPSFTMTYQSPMLGILGEPLGSQEQFAEFFGVKDGVLVKSVNHNSAAEKAGLKAGDVIVKVDDQPVSTTQNISKALREARSKKTVTVVVVRQKKEMPITVTLDQPALTGRGDKAE